MKQALLTWVTLAVLLAGCGNNQAAPEPVSVSPNADPAEVIVETEPVVEVAPAKSVTEALPDVPLVALPTKIGDCVELTALERFPRFARPEPDPNDPNYDPEFWAEIAIGVRFNSEWFPYTDQGPEEFAPYLGKGEEFEFGPDFAPGNLAQVCLVKIPDCAVENKENPYFRIEDQRGRVYRFTDKKTGAKVEQVESWRLCGGA